MYSSTYEPSSRGSGEERDWSDENQTFYYSKFQLFDDNEDITKYHLYSSFLDRVSKQLGQQWEQQANCLYQPYFQSKDIFLILLTIWLNDHPVIKKNSSEKLNKNNHQILHSQYLVDFHQKIREQLKMKNIQSQSSLKQNNMSAKAICMGFYLTVNEIWEQMFEKKHQNQNQAFPPLKGVERKNQEKLEPVMVVTERINNMFGRKKVKKSWEMRSQLNLQHKEKNHQKCYSPFQKKLNLQQEIIKKLGQLSFEENQEKSQIWAEEDKKIFHKYKFKDSEVPIQKNFLQKMYQYLTGLLKVKESWQVANSFVTNILNITEFQLKNDIKVKVLRPAEDFYQKLFYVWLTIKTKNKKLIPFEQFKQNVQCSLGSLWNNKYLIPIKYFYELMNRNWEQISKHSQISSDQSMMKKLLKKTREAMKKDWQYKINIDRKKKNQVQKYFFLLK